MKGILIKVNVNEKCRKGKISIIIPVYNIEAYIGKCIESCLSQSYGDFEIILVDDGSTDCGGEICDQYAKRDKRIRVLHQKNQGLSTARNNAINIAEGEYIVFVDGDDFISPNLLQISLNALKKSNSDIVFFQYQLWSESKVSSNNNIIGNEIISSENCLELLLQHKLCDMVWHGFYRRSIIGNIKFPVDKINEDVHWKYKIIQNAERIMIISDCLYYYRVRSGSIMQSSFSWRRLDGLYGSYLRALEIGQKYPSLKVLAYSEVWSNCILFYGLVKKSFTGGEQLNGKKLILEYKRNLPLKIGEIIRELRISKMRKGALIICKISFRFSAWMMTLILKGKYANKES